MKAEFAQEVIGVLTEPVRTHRAFEGHVIVVRQDAKLVCPDMLRQKISRPDCSILGSPGPNTVASKPCDQDDAG